MTGFKHRGRHPGWTSNFGEFIHRHGTERLCEDLQVSVFTVYKWIHRDFEPTPPNARALVNLARREKIPLTLDDIYFREK